MALSPRKIRNYSAILVSGGLTTALVVWPQGAWPHLPRPGLWTEGPAKAVLLTAAFALATAVTAFLLPILTGRRRLTSGVFFLTVGLAVVSVAGSGGLSARLALTGTALLGRGVELLVLAGVLFNAVLLWRWAGQRGWPALLGLAAPGEAGDLLPTRAEMRSIGLPYAAAVAAVGYLLSTQFVPGDGRGQAAFGTWAAFLLATVAGHQVLRVGESLWLAAPPLALGVVGYAAAGVAFATGAVPPDTRALMALANPCDFAGPAVAGCMMGFWASEHIWQWRRKRRKPAPQAQPTRPAARDRRGRKRR